MGRGNMVLFMRSLVHGKGQHGFVYEVFSIWKGQHGSVYEVFSTWEGAIWFCF